MKLRREGILEYYWGEHIHLGYYSAAERAAGYKKKDFKLAKIDFVDEMLRWSGAQAPARVLDVGCGIGGTSRHLAARFPDAQVQGAPVACAGYQHNAYRASRLSAWLIGRAVVAAGGAVKLLSVSRLPNR